ncbi:hypothetical protein GQ43DRAFT_501826 [Delitschia confertaspora ATCC 74209]|uniref:RING-type domain-containing protein n=1 Tax=Delitschia confertaspora ATCC 74209 TaxID=1513339 RepID=A0A9P4JNG9_9PLEO|nr:hypothetical protein GQ43DRAFT_501826 [Delitschia confertaspora ATCC 74209]
MAERFFPPTRTDFIQNALKELSLECPLCLSAWDAYHVPVQITGNPKCSHIFCRPCISGWLETTQRQAYTCPLCRNVLISLELDEDEDEEDERYLGGSGGEDQRDRERDRQRQEIMQRIESGLTYYIDNDGNEQMGDYITVKDDDDEDDGNGDGVGDDDDEEGDEQEGDLDEDMEDGEEKIEIFDEDDRERRHAQLRQLRYEIYAAHYMNLAEPGRGVAPGEHRR